MMIDFEVWIYRGIIAIAAIIIWWAVRRFAINVMDKFDELIKAIASLDGKYIAQEGQIKQIADQQGDHSKRLNDHATRLRNAELKQARCRNYQEK